MKRTSDAGHGLQIPRYKVYSIHSSSNALNVFGYMQALIIFIC